MNVVHSAELNGHGAAEGIPQEHIIVLCFIYEKQCGRATCKKLSVPVMTTLL